ncbi:MAG: tetratricopeptide repeat protein [Nitrospirae bacterium]|nr:tetratricopeptide repeat protein [Nitrospirota bacterium]
MEKLPKGNIRDTSLVKILVQLNRNRRTGTLSLATASFTKKIYLSEGDVIFASSTYEDDRLGEMLLKAGKITVEQYDKSVEILKSTRNKRQGAILVELGYLTPKDLFWGVKYQVHEIIHSMFIVEEGDYEFHEGELPTQEVITLRMSIGNLIYTGVNKIVNWTRIRNEMPHTDSVLKLGEDPLSLFQEIELSQQDKKILSLVDGKRTIKEIIDSSWMGSFEALKVLYVLWSIGMVEDQLSADVESSGLEDENKVEDKVTLNDILTPLSEEDEILLRKVDEIYSQLGSLTMTELLEIEGKADSETIKRNYYRLAKEFHPDRYFSSTDPSVKIKLTTIFDAITKAYNVLKDDRSRNEYLASLLGPKQEEGVLDTGMRAAEQFKEGVADFKKGDFWGAIDKFKWATKMEPKNVNYWSYLSLACSKVPGRVKEAEEALLTALKLDPFNAELHSHLGLVYMKAGIKKRAHAAFQKALKIDPKNEKARKGLDSTKD